jgi:hypothetical protein
MVPAMAMRVRSSAVYETQRNTWQAKDAENGTSRFRSCGAVFFPLLRSPVRTHLSQSVVRPSSSRKRLCGSSTLSEASLWLQLLPSHDNIIPDGASVRLSLARVIIHAEVMPGDGQ